MMTPVEAVAALIRIMPKPLSVELLEEYGITVPESDIQVISREIVSLNLYWILAAIDAHIPLKYRTVMVDSLMESVKKTWWETGMLGSGTWDAYQQELDERRAEYGHLVDYEGMNHMAVSAEAASRIEDHGGISSEDRSKLLVLLIDHAPAAEYGKILEGAA